MEKTANAFAPHFIADFNARFATPHKRSFNAHQPLREDEDDTDATHKLINQYIEVYECPDGHIELRANGTSLPYQLYDRLSEIDQSAVVDHIRLSHVLQVVQCMQAQRDNRRAGGSPSRTNQGAVPRQKEHKAWSKKQR
ncbi:hypothetical protein BGZ92_010663 [Podila epicladia]|nr:hypothetical protein BGZ92_010663 [Podila epicladia]